MDSNTLNTKLFGFSLSKFGADAMEVEATWIQVNSRFA